MASIKSKYLGNLRTESLHIKSGNSLISDAPTDNKGKGESFSPTDLVCVSLGTCMLTIMGIYAEKEGIDMVGMEMDISKRMTANPRRIAKIEIDFHWSHPKLGSQQIEGLKNAALNCPVALNLHPDLKQVVNFNF